MGSRPDKRSFTQSGGRGSYAGNARQGCSRRGSKGASPARMSALEAVRILRERDAFAQDVMARVVDKARLSSEDRAFATRLVLGVVSTRGVLDDVLNRCMHAPDDVTPEVRDALQISTYEIIFLEKSPHAAVDQGVEMVRSVAPRAGGVANAVLRKVVAAKRSFPFGDPSRDIAAYARLHGFPLWLVKRLIEDLGAGPAHQLIKASNEPAPVFVAVNAAKAADEEVVSVLAAAHGEPEPALVNGRVVPGCFRIADGRVLLDGRVARMLNNGLMLVSDAASQAVASLVLARGDESAFVCEGDEAHGAHELRASETADALAKPASLLEIGAGRATKTILLQSGAQRRWGSQISEYVALDNLGFKTSLLEKRAQDYDVQVSEAITADATALDAAVGSRTFDVVFIDAPCSGLGTLRRHPEIRWRLRPQTIDEHARIGLAMLESAASHVVRGGTLAYATCTVTPEENAHVVARFLKSAAGTNFELVSACGASAFATEVTSGGNDAHFCAIMRRKGL